MVDFKATIAANTETIATLHSLVQETLKDRNKSPGQNKLWKTACAEFQRRYDGLAFPGGYSTAKERLRAGDIDSIEAALCFVELRPYFFRSGYMFKELLRLLKRVTLTPGQRERFSRVALAHQEWRAQQRAQRRA